MPLSQTNWGWLYESSLSILLPLEPNERFNNNQEEEKSLPLMNAPNTDSNNIK